jgi:hypothetical protein
MGSNRKRSDMGREGMGKRGKDKGGMVKEGRGHATRRSNAHVTELAIERNPGSPGRGECVEVGPTFIGCYLR